MQQAGRASDHDAAPSLERGAVVHLGALAQERDERLGRLPLERAARGLLALERVLLLEDRVELEVARPVQDAVQVVLVPELASCRLMARRASRVQ